MSATEGGAASAAPGGAAAAACALLAVSFGLSLTVGASGLGPGELWTGVLSALGRAPASEAAQFARTVLFGLRLPRAVTAALCGGALASAGVVSQGLFRNSLASPSVLGSEAGGSLAAVLLFYVGAAYWHWLTLPLAAFAGALAATALVCRMASARRPGQMETLLLAGFAVNAFAGALTSLVVSLALEDYQQAAAVMHWLLGGFAAKGWEHAAMAATPLAVGFGLAWSLAPRLDVLALGEDVAATLSVDPRRLRREAILAMAVLVGSAVAVAGAIPFVGLVVPHLTRRLVGPGHRRLLPLSAVNGMSLTLLADVAARTVRSPAELEVGILTSLLGAPFFLWLLLRRGRPG